MPTSTASAFAAQFLASDEASARSEHLNSAPRSAEAQERIEVALSLDRGSGHAFERLGEVCS